MFHKFTVLHKTKIGNHIAQWKSHQKLELQMEDYLKQDAENQYYLVAVQKVVENSLQRNYIASGYGYW